MAQIGPRVEIKGMKSIVMKKLIEGKVFKRLLNVAFCEKCEVNCNNKKNLEDIK